MVDIPSGFKPMRFDSPFLKHVGPLYEGVRDGMDVMGLPISPHHVNTRDVVHGGILATMADVGLSYPVAVSEEPNLGVVTISLTTDFLGPARLGQWLETRGHIDRMGRSTVFCHGSLIADGETVLTMSGVFKIYRAKAE